MSTISEKTQFTLGVVIVVASALIGAGTYLGSVNAQAKSIQELQTKYESLERRYSDDILSIKVGIARIESTLESIGRKR